MNKLTDFITKAFVEIREETVEEIPDTGKLLEIGTGDIRPNPSQPRRHFSPEELTSLAKSITANGIIQPLTVRQTENDFELISGERRLRAAKLAGLKTVPCILIEADKKRSAVLALLENIQRSDLNCFEEAAAINKLIESGEITREKISIKLGMARSTIANKLRLLKLTDEEQQLMIEKGLTERHARALLRVADEDRRKEILAKTINGSWTVDTLEKYIDRLERQELKKTSYEKRAVMLKDVRLFFNSVNKALEVMKLAGVEATAKRIDREDHIEYTIVIKNTADEKSV
ncbi:ParB/RepB/Spo0J family partition protein [Ruminococcus albus]|uniref:ParB-like partition protein n=1 Tax=Ruminococcus albus (strain ATCC 27210 / DSM 20455 / JCM 14654 / NCDO 2250 / 7) TaxID=697329 RepID=E6UB36_RUMA7|nr:ParB/RepB/Spo0J family partition protein [Ruminococcus albus]ADU20577.1 parB-like partition protein [Ruminococcus albus 7 = DSM 20455]